MSSINSSGDRRKDNKGWFKEWLEDFWDDHSETILGWLFTIIAGTIVIGLIVLAVSGFNSCNRRMELDDEHKLNIIYNKLPNSETPLRINESIVFNNGSTDSLYLVFYYHLEGQVNQHVFSDIPLSKCIFIDEGYKESRHEKQKYTKFHNINVKGDSINLFIVDNKPTPIEILEYIKEKKDPNITYYVYGSLDSIASYIGIRKKPGN